MDRERWVGVRGVGKSTEDVLVSFAEGWIFSRGIVFFLVSIFSLFQRHGFSPGLHFFEKNHPSAPLP